MKNIFRSLKIYNFRLFFTGQIISLTGTWIQQLASAWLAYSLTHSGIWLGIVSFAGQIPVLILGPLAGALIDRTNRQKLLIWTQILAMIQAFGLAYLTLKGLINIYYLLGLSIFLGAINAFDMPVRQAFVTDMVSREHLHNAIALNSTTVNFSRMLGPALAGIIVAKMGEGLCFLFNGFSFLAALVSLMLMKNLLAPVKKKEKENVLTEIRDGFIHVWERPLLRVLLISLVFISSINMAQVVTMPIFAEKILKGAAETLGLLMAFIGLGSFLGTFYLAGQKSTEGLEDRIKKAIILIGICFILFPLWNNLFMACLILLVIGFAFLIVFAGSNTIFQLGIEEKFRGRVMSLYTMTFIGLAPFGSLIGGILVSNFGIFTTYVIFGISMGLIAWWVALQTKNLKIRSAVGTAPLAEKN